MINLHNIDCMDFMRGLPDKAYELAIVDPPYGNGHDFGGRPAGLMYSAGDQWNTKPQPEYFIELKRVCKNYIVWGGNYFKELWPCKDFVVWDKRQPEGISFAMVELAATSFDGVAKLHFTKPAGERGFYTVDCKRIHPTQKPVALYKWLLNNYAKPGDKILDTHGGSMSIAIACYDLGFSLDLCELDPDYYGAGKQRLDDHIAKYAPATDRPVTNKGELKLF